MIIASAQVSEFFDPDSALALMLDYANQAAKQKAQVICFPEGFLTGYALKNIKELSLERSSQRFAKILKALFKLPIAVIFGFMEKDADAYYNSALFIHKGSVRGLYRKRYLLNKENGFTPGSQSPVFQLDNFSFGLLICSDSNDPNLYEALKIQGAQFIFCLANNMLPQQVALKWEHKHHEIRSAFCKHYGMWMVSSDVTGDKLGHLALGPTALIDSQGCLVQQLPLKKPGLLIADVPF